MYIMYSLHIIGEKKGIFKINHSQNPASTALCSTIKHSQFNVKAKNAGANINL